VRNVKHPLILNRHFKDILNIASTEGRAPAGYRTLQLISLAEVCWHKEEPLDKLRSSFRPIELAKPEAQMVQQSIASHG
jgi:hypothetical protein